MMGKSRALLLMSLISCLILPGCWDRRELNELGLVTALGIDKAGDQYDLTAQFVNPGEIASKEGGGGGGGRSPATLYSAKGATLFEAIKRMSAKAPRIIYLSHLQMVIISEEVAREGMGEVLDLLSRNYQMRTDFYLTVARDEAAKTILSILTPLDKIPSQNMFSKIEKSDREWGATSTVKLDELINDLASKGKSAALTGIRVLGDEQLGGSSDNVQRIRPGAIVAYSGIAVFNKADKMLGWLSEKESKGYHFTQKGKVQSTLIQFTCPAGKKQSAETPSKAFANVEIIRTHTEVKGKMAGGKPAFEILVRAEGNIGEVQCKDIDLTKTATIRQFEQKAEEDIKHSIEQALTKARSLKTDILGFGEVLHRSDPKAWKSLKSHWHENGFPEAAVRISAKVNIRRVGTVTNSFLKDLPKQSGDSQ